GSPGASHGRGWGRWQQAEAPSGSVGLGGEAGDRGGGEEGDGKGGAGLGAAIVVGAGVLWFALRRKRGQG
ncbi:WD40 repeat domain-containing protein, partial [Streptomyces sp. FL06-04B]|nr:WD40 repeat domain-containing protein [Streptomyces sp. FL06-04B]